MLSVFIQKKPAIFKLLAQKIKTQGISMKQVFFLAIILLAACTQTESASQTAIQTPRNNTQSATIQINGLGKEINLSALPENSDLLFFGEVGDTSAIIYGVLSANETSIALSNNPQVESDLNQWQLQVSQDVPLNLVLDIADGSLNAQLTETQLMRFDLVSNNSSVDIQFPAFPFTLTLDMSNSTSSLTLPTGAFIFLERLSNQGGFMTISVGEGVSFEGNINIGAGGLTLQIPQTTGVQIIVESAQGSEISLPDISRINAEETSYSTLNFDTASAQIILAATLDGTAIRIVQEE
jgi:hypothetical protein